MAVQELLPSGINAVCLVCQSLPSDHFVLELDVCQLVCQFRHIGTFDHLRGWREVQLEQELVEKSLRVDDTVVREDLVVQSTTRAQVDLAEVLTLDALEQDVVLLLL